MDRAHAHAERGLLLLDSGDLPAATDALEQAMLRDGRLGDARESFRVVESLWARCNPGSRWQLQAQQWAARADTP